MAEETKNPAQEQEIPPEQETAEEVKTAEEKAEPEKAEPQPEPDPVQAMQKQLDEEKDRYLRLAAEYDNFRKRSQKEKDSSYTNGKSDAILKFLPVYDNLERALNQATADEAYRKGVEMTMAGLKTSLESLGITAFGAAGDAFDPSKYNAVMHTEDENLGENVVAEVFQKGFLAGDKVIRFAMVKVAN